ncbi:MAG TPA: DUF1329 domain-containing protein [Candidatus Binataceae bacterium]|jgi:hypothetical protein|nr:DUF1329 domain-containing protein [Candidatus Binataceae bacterium]
MSAISKLNRLTRLWIIIPLLALIGLSATQASAAGVTYDTGIYKQMVDASSNATIPPGTVIKLDNWTRYKAFMPLFLQVLFSGQYPIKFGPEPEYNITVGPTENYPYTAQYAKDTEKYFGQTKLVPVPDGSYTISPPVQDSGGLPFGPNPTEPLLAYKVIYNYWMTYQPRIVDYFAFNWLSDRYHNITTTITDDVSYRLSHLSEPGLPHNLPESAGYLASGRYLVITPEQSKYTTEIELTPADPVKDPESYVFLPSLRRALRLSSAAKCAPILGTDFINDDPIFQIPYFKISFLGEKKMLWPLLDTEGSTRAESYVTKASGILGWPKPGISRWQLRDMYILDLQPLPVIGRYCFNHKIMYIDKDGFIQSVVEEFDHGDKYWRVSPYRQRVIEYLGQKTLISAAGSVSNGPVDFQNSHQTIAFQYDLTIGPKVPGRLQDPAMALPGSLSQVMK